MAGGTGGHVMPGLAVARELTGRGAQVSWLGTAAGIESTLVPAANIPLYTIAGRGWRGSGWLKRVTAPFMLLRSLWQAWSVLRRARPVVVLGMGGYAAGPGGLVAWLMRVPLILHEQNCVIGLTNRLLRPLARMTLFGFSPASGIGDGVGAEAGQSAGPQIRVTGNPLLAALQPAATPRQDDKLRILLLGGSQGARVLNRAMVGFCDTQMNKGEQGFELWHQCGQKLLEETRELYAASASETPINLRLCGFIDDMAAAYSWADLVIARAGALTISELCAAGKPSILIPLPTAAGNHQTANARYLADRNAAVLLPQTQLVSAGLEDAVQSLIDSDRRRAMAGAAAQLARPDAAQQVAAACLEWCDA